MKGLTIVVQTLDEVSLMSAVKSRFPARRFLWIFTLLLGLVYWFQLIVYQPILLVHFPTPQAASQNNANQTETDFYRQQLMPNGDFHTWSSNQISYKRNILHVPGWP
jgi:hypothetical protein